MNLPRTFQPTGCELIGPESPEATTFAGSAISTSKPSRLDLRAVSVRDHTESATTGHSIQRHGAGQSRSSATWPCFRVAAFLPEESWGPGPTFSVQSYVQLATEQNTLALGWSVCSKRFQIFCNPQCCWNLQNRLQCPGCYCGRPKQSKPNSHSCSDSNDLPMLIRSHTEAFRPGSALCLCRNLSLSLIPLFSTHEGTPTAATIIDCRKEWPYLLVTAGHFSSNVETSAEGLRALATWMCCPGCRACHVQVPWVQTRRSGGFQGIGLPLMDHACLQGPDTAARRQDPSATNPCSKASHADSAAAADE